MASTIYLSASRSHRPPVLRFAAHVFMSRNISLIFLHNADLGVFFQIRVVGSACGLGYETFHCYFYITQIWEFVYQIRVVGSTCDYVDCSLRLLAVRGPAKFCSKALQISSTMNPKVMKNGTEIRTKS